MANANFAGQTGWTLGAATTISAAIGVTIGQTGTVADVVLNGVGALLNAGSLSLQAGNTLIGSNTLDLESGAINIGNVGSSVVGNIQIGTLGVVTMQGTGATPGAVIIDNAAGGSLVNAGTVQVLNGSLDLNANLAGSGVYLATSGGLLQIDKAVALGTTISLGGVASAGVLNLTAAGNFKGTIANFWQGTGGGNAVLIANTGNYLSKSWSQTNSNIGTLTVNTTGGAYALAIAGAHPFGFNVVNDAAVSGVEIVALDAQTNDVAAVRNLGWTGFSGGGLLSNASNWNDITDALNPATAAPGTADSVTFLSNGGLLTGTIAVAGVTFGGNTAFSLNNNASMTDTGEILVGQSSPNGFAQLSILTGSTLTSGASVSSGPAADIAGVPGSDGSQVSVNGSKSDWSVKGQLNVGDAAAGALAITAGGTVAASSLDIGVQSAGSGQVSVNGASSNITLTGNLKVGDSGIADLSILNKGVVNVVNADLGVLAGSSGNVDIEGAGSQLNVTGDLNVGDAGTGILTVGAGATLHVVGNLNQNASSVLTVSGVIDPTSGTLSNSSQLNVNGTLQYTSTLTLKGTITATGTNANLWVANLTGTGMLSIGSGADLILGGGTGGTDGPVFFGASTPGITFQDNTGTLHISDLAGITNTTTISGYTTGDKIFVNTAFAAEAYNNGTLTLYSDLGETTPVGSLVFAGSHALADFTSGVQTSPCYAEGTRILTARGEILVEALAAGDLLPTMLHGGGLSAIKWIGVSTVRLDNHPDPDRAAPIRIRAGALGQGTPHRDLRLSPEHAMLIDGHLVPAALLVNGASIIREPASGTVRYFHIELDRHDVILAEGAPGETYLDTGNRDQFDNAGTVRQLHPAFDSAGRALAIWASESAAPILLEGEALVEIHARLAARAALLGHARTADPALSLQAGGQTLKLTRLADDLWQASLPAGVGSLRLLSRSFVPSADDRRAEDHRSLGLAVADLLLDGVALPESCFAQGFHAAECDASGSWRWTDGAGLVRLAPAAQPRRVTLRLRSGWVKYWAAA